MRVSPGLIRYWREYDVFYNTDHLTMVDTVWLNRFDQTLVSGLTQYLYSCFEMSNRILHFITGFYSHHR